MGNRNLLAANLRKNVRISRFGNGLPRQSADWLAMTGFFDSLKVHPLRDALFRYGVTFENNIANLVTLGYAVPPAYSAFSHGDGAPLTGSIKRSRKMPSSAEKVQSPPCRSAMVFRLRQP